jgi:hypothetical protein
MIPYAPTVEQLSAALTRAGIPAQPEAVTRLLTELDPALQGIAALVWADGYEESIDHAPEDHWGARWDEGVNPYTGEAAWSWPTAP